tara:strand:- start:38 stop:1243 length:1206 start_codon:yes stop_codon:yes gene_type:complete
MKVQVVTEPRAGGKKLCVQVVWQENGKIKKQTKEVFGLNEKRKAEALRSKLEIAEKVDVIDQKITFDFAFKEYFKVIEKELTTSPKYKKMQVAYIVNHVKPYINKQHLSEYLLSDFKEHTLPKIIQSKRLDWRTKDGKSFYVKRLEAIGKTTIQYSVLEFKKFINWCASRNYKTDYTIANFKFSHKFFEGYSQQKRWMPTSKELLDVVNQEQDIKMKLFYTCAAETGIRLNELCGICYESVDFENGLLYIDHSLCGENQFRPYQVKTSRRAILITPKLLNLFAIWMKTQIFPLTHRNVMFKNPDTNKMEKRSFKRMFNLTINRANKKIKQSAKKLGIDWQNGMSPFRKWSISRLTDLKVLTDKQMDDRFANSKEIRKNNYIRDLNLNEKERMAAFNLITEG